METFQEHSSQGCYLQRKHKLNNSRKQKTRPKLKADWLSLTPTCNYQELIEKFE